MFSTVQNRLESTLSYFRYGSQPLLPTEIHKSLENQVLSAERTIQDHRIASTPPSIWKRVASLSMSYLVFSSSQSSIRETCFSGVGGYVSEPWALPLTFVAGLSLFPGMVHAQSPDTTYFKAFGGANDDRGRAITTTPEGDLIVAGQTNSFGVGLDDVLLSKFSNNGTLLWTSTLGGASSDVSWALTITPEGDLIVAGETASFGAGDTDVLLSKFSSNGTFLWANTLGGIGTDRGYALTATPEGDFVVAGETASFGEGGSDVLLSKFSSNGTLLWAKTLGGINEDRSQTLSITSEGDLIVAGATSSFGAGTWDMLLSKFSSNGTLLWANTLGGANDDFVWALTVTSEGDMAVAGETFSFGVGTPNVLLSKFSSNGTFLWANTLGEIGADRGYALTATPEGDFVVAGYTSGFGAEGSDVLLSKFSSNGTLLWANILGGPSSDRGWDLTATSEGDLIVAGWTGSFGAGGVDVLITKFNVQGSIGNCSAWQIITPQVQSVTPNIADVTLNMAAGIPPWTNQDATSALNITDITSLLSQTTVCYEETVITPTLFTSASVTPSSQSLSRSLTTSGFTLSSSQNLSSNLPPSSPGARPSINSTTFADITPSSQSPSKSFSTNSLPFSSQSLSSNSPLSSPKASPSTTPVNQEVTERSRTTSSPTLTQTNSSTSNTGILSIREISYGQSYPIQIGGEEIGIFTFSGGEGFVNPNGDNLITIEFHNPSDIEDGEKIVLFTYSDYIENFEVELSGEFTGCRKAIEEVNETEDGKYEYAVSIESQTCASGPITLLASTAIIVN